MLKWHFSDLKVEKDGNNCVLRRQFPMEHIESMISAGRVLGHFFQVKREAPFGPFSHEFVF